jgi:ATP-dependent RNA helicase DeaD
LNTQVQLKASDKIEALRRYLDYDADMTVLCFVVQTYTQQVADELNNNGYATEAPTEICLKRSAMR